MAEKNEGVVVLVAPNGQTVSVAESKLVERLHGGYRLPEKRSSSRASTKK